MLKMREIEKILNDYLGDEATVTRIALRRPRRSGFDIRQRKLSHGYSFVIDKKDKRDPKRIAAEIIVQYRTV